ALISVSNKTKLASFVKKLISFNYEIISTGGTKKYLEDNQIPVIGIEEITHFPEMLDGRVKTLHPNIHAGLLFKRDNKTHVNTIQEHNIKPIDLVVVNLYPFKETISKKNMVLEEAIEQIDIGGPSMLRSAAKNYTDVTVIVDTLDYDLIIQELKETNKISILTNQKLAVKVFQHTAGYDTLIAQYLNSQTKNQPIFADKFTTTFEKIMDLRYGENPHQKAAYYKNGISNNVGLTNAQQIQGKELSYNNILDANAAIEIITEFKNEKAVVAVKHNNPCGVGVANNLYTAWQKAFSADKISIFGGIIAFNDELDEKIAIELKELFLEVIIAPAYTKKA
ncbi:MAG: bifunctional phosphoribosylaminoimidazolecarboxamide formyltransferase/IMP cyclohydrolase, partial [Sediminibacterium sp.]|nr:bifunctional phosphoribosylaminoimidazolecarboxamide formyltransferase/IMP cyclohydrolase [Sediminibacterium sp.]